MERIASLGVRSIEVYIDKVWERKPGRGTDRVLNALNALKELGYEISYVKSYGEYSNQKRRGVRRLPDDEIRRIILEDIRRGESRQEIHADARLTDADVSSYKIGAYLSHVSRGTYHKRKLLRKDQRLFD